MPRVSVVIPAYNARNTIMETLRSVLNQTLRDIEVIVVDDGSTDETVELVRAVAATDSRIRLFSIANSGVAGARNKGLQEAGSTFVAPLDADDLWRPEKLERQLALIESAPSVTLVYSSFRYIDADSIVDANGIQADIEGNTYVYHLAYNMVGNGSSILFRRSDALAVGGYDARLRDLDAQGCEDFLLQCRLARHGNVRAEPGYLVGYRRVPGAMSRNALAMQRSRILALRFLAGEDPRVARLCNSFAAILRIWLAAAYVRRGMIGRGLSEVLTAARDASGGLPVTTFAYGRYTLDRYRHRLEGRRLSKLSNRRKFDDFPPDGDTLGERPAPIGRLIHRLPTVPFLPFPIVGATTPEAPVVSVVAESSPPISRGLSRLSAR